jgi:protocatechuate 3,4-dioxygenase alpha subunit
MAGITPSATVGPFFLFGLVPSTIGGTDIITSNLVTPDASGERIRIEGRVLDGDGVPVPDALIEIWQADAAGRYASAVDTRARPNSAFKGFGRAPTGKDGDFSFETVKPGGVAGPNGAMQAPHIAVNVFSRGVVKQMVTRIYFSGEPANASDPVLALVPPERRATLIAERAANGADIVYRFDIRLQGENETVFFDV